MYGLRLKTGLNKIGMQQKELAVLLNVNPKTINAIASELQKMTPELALEIEKATGISAVYLLIGKGDILVDASDSLATTFGYSVQADKERIRIPFFSEIKASAGYGYTNDEHCPMELITIPRAILPTMLGISKLEAIRVFGDSMYPNIKENDIAFVTRNISDIESGRIYIIKKDDMQDLYIKRLFKTKAEQVIVKSDNPLYPEEIYKIDEIEIVAKLIMNITEV